MTSFTCPLSVHCGGVQRQGSLAPAPLDCSTSEAFSPRTVLAESICKCVQHTLQHFPTILAFLANRHNNLFLPGYSSSPGWLLVTRTRGAWWCRYRGCCRSGPRHRSPRSRVCAQEWHCKDIHSHIHSHTPIHTPQKKKKKKREREREKKRRTKRSTHQIWCLRLLVLFLSSGLVGDGQKAWHLLLWTAPRRRPSRLEQYWQ